MLKTEIKSNQTKPDAREWYQLDMELTIIFQVKEATAKFCTKYPIIGFIRLTFLGLDRGEPWLCIDNWLTPPQDQGPEPTDQDIPMGFV